MTMEISKELEMALRALVKALQTVVELDRSKETVYRVALDATFAKKNAPSPVKQASVDHTKPEQVETRELDEEGGDNSSTEELKPAPRKDPIGYIRLRGPGRGVFSHRRPKGEDVVILKEGEEQVEEYPEGTLIYQEVYPEESESDGVSDLPIARTTSHKDPRSSHSASPFKSPKSSHTPGIQKPVPFGPARGKMLTATRSKVQKKARARK